MFFYHVYLETEKDIDDNVKHLKKYYLTLSFQKKQEIVFENYLLFSRIAF